MTKRNLLSIALAPVLALVLASCDGAADRQAAPSARPADPAPAAVVAATAAPDHPETTNTDTGEKPIRSCAAEIGVPAADRRAAVCRNVSPATRPPCNAADSCAMIEDEIARSCALLGRDGALPADCTDPKSSKAAVAVVKRYYAALDAGDYATAWRQWGEAGPPNQTQEKFRAGFAHTRSTRARIGTPGDPEGGAGSIYLTVPVTVDATLDTGKTQVFEGEYILRRVNDVDGATPDQLRWHITAARLRAR